MIHIQNTLYTWHKTITRDMPWKEDKDPYKIWLSEIILQQTRVEQGKPYYLKFIEKWPTIEDLSKANEDEVLLLWQGLGYYSRGRNLLKTAQQIVRDYNGFFPKDFQEIKKLKGIGDYTAAAILSFAYDQPYPVIDGNVKRVISRWFNISTPIDSKEGLQEITQNLYTIFDKTQAATFNQAIMDFGALQCTPKPKCASCLLNIFCQSYYQNTANLLPIKGKKIEKKNRYFQFLYIHFSDSFIIERRGKNDIWEGLYQLPLIEAPHISETLIKLKIQEIIGENMEYITSKNIDHGKHVLTHQNILYYIHDINFMKTPSKINNNYIPIHYKDHSKYGFPQLLKKSLKRYSNGIIDNCI